MLALLFPLILIQAIGAAPVGVTNQVKTVASEALGSIRKSQDSLSVGFSTEKVEHLAVPVSKSRKIMNFLGLKTTEKVASYPAPKITAEGAEFRFSEGMRFGGQKENLGPEVMDILTENVVLKAPPSLKEWKYGETKTLSSENSVKLKSLSRQSRIAEWVKPTESSSQVLVTATRFPGKKGSPDIFLIKDIQKISSLPSSPTN